LTAESFICGAFYPTSRRATCAGTGDAEVGWAARAARQLCTDRIAADSTTFVAVAALAWFSL